MTRKLISQIDAHASDKRGHVTARKLTGQKPALNMREVWSIRTRLEFDGDVRSLALFNLAINSKLRGYDLVRHKVSDVAAGGDVRSRGAIIQKKTGRPVQFEFTESTRRSVSALLAKDKPRPDNYLFQSRLRGSPHLSTRQYARIVQDWVASTGLNPAACGTHSLRRTKAALIYRKTGNLRAVQLLLGHTKLLKHGSIPWLRCGRRA
jgi:integrase